MDEKIKLVRGDNYPADSYIVDNDDNEMFIVKTNDAGEIICFICTIGETFEYGGNGYITEIESDPRYATQEEIDWIDYCYSIKEYCTQEEALENKYAREFIEQYLTEE